MSKVTAKNELQDHLRAGEYSSEPDYLAWKEAKILKGLKQSKERASLIPSDEVWEDLGREH